MLQAACLSKISDDNPHVSRL
jgi:cyclophilin family peptidyl-prolyl cis-trans isomerase